MSNLEGVSLTHPIIISILVSTSEADFHSLSTLVGAEVAESSRPMCAAFPRLTTSYKQDLFAKSKDKHRLLN